MPEPLSKVPPVAVNLAATGYVTSNPELAALALEAIASWANVELYQLMLFVDLLGGDHSIATDIYLALETDGPKRAAIRAAANASLSPDRLELLQAIFSLTDTATRQRNKLAHWVWGYSPDLPDAFILADPRAAVLDGPRPDQMFVYRAADFRQLIAMNDRITTYFMDFAMVRSGKPEADERLHVLLQQPEIAEKLATRRAQRDRAAQAKPPRPPSELLKE
jgi:hypothetical protein